MGKEETRPKLWEEKSASCKGWLCRQFLRLEWWCEWAAYWLSKRAFLKVLEYLGKLTLLVSLILWIHPGYQQRKEAADNSKKSRHYVAWQTINSAVGKPGNAGRNDALEDLSRDSVPLTGISLTGGAVIIGPLNLSKSRMERADFSGGYYENVNFSRAELTLSKWDDTICERCDFRGASLWGVTFKHSSFVLCDFGYAGEGKNQRPSDFIMQFAGNQMSEFRICNFVGADSPLGIWQNVSFFNCNLAFATLWQPAIGTNSSLFCCNLYGATTSSPEFIKWAYGQLLAFTNITSLERWNYCVTNRIVLYQNGGPQFMEWASNQFTTYIKTNDTQAWLEWSRDNLHH
jgi:hypothetical protein